MKTDEPKRDENAFCRGQRMVLHGTSSYFDYYQASIGIVLGLHRRRSLVRLKSPKPRASDRVRNALPKELSNQIALSTYPHKYIPYLYIYSYKYTFFSKKQKKNR